VHVGETRIRTGAVVAIAVTAGLVTWLALRSTVGSSAAPAVQPAPASTAATQGVLTAAGLRAAVRALGQPVYWAGERPADRYELTVASGRVYVRYLPAGARSGDTRPRYLVVATYPLAGALGSLRQLANGHGVPLPGGGLALVSAGYPQSWHLAFPGVDYEVEVYDPSAAVAKRVALTSVRAVR